MNEHERMVEGAGTHIWLHYATTVTIGGKTHTLEMGIPVPLGADDALREQLMREAETGMNQLIGHVENQVARLLQRVQPTQGAIPAPIPAAKPSVTPPPRPRPTASGTPTVSTSPNTAPVSPNASLPPSAAPQAVQAQGREPREARETREIREVREPVRERESSPPVSSANATGQQGQSTRQNIGMTLPSTGELGRTLSLPQFISYIGEHLGLNPKQAMEILKVKSLSGINLRDALEQLQRAQGEGNTDNEGNNIKANVGSGDTNPSMKAVSGDGQRAEKAERVERPDGLSSEHETNNASRASTPKQPIPFRPNATKSGELPVNTHVVRESPPRFDEELDEDDEPDIEIEDELDDILLDDEEEAQTLTPQDRVYASNQVNKLRESQGASLVSPARLKVLSNVIGDQLEPTQLDDLIRGVWGITQTKRLKVDQAEALISWAKEDDFYSEAELVLLFLEEDALARGNR